MTTPGAAPPPAPAPSPGPAPSTGSAPSAGPAPWAGQGPTAGPGPSTAPLRKVGIGTPVPTLVTGALAYLVALVAALVVIVSAVLAVLTADTGASTDPTGVVGAPATDDTGFAGIIGLLGIPFQLVALASFGSYDAEPQMGFLGSLSLSWRGLPLLITAAMTVFAFLAARTAQRRWSSNGPLGAALWSGLSGLGVALVALLVTRLTAFSIEDPANGLSLSMHAAGADMFFGTWALITLAAPARPSRGDAQARLVAAGRRPRRRTPPRARPRPRLRRPRRPPRRRGWSDRADRRRGGTLRARRGAGAAAVGTDRPRAPARSRDAGRAGARLRPGRRGRPRAGERHHAAERHAEPVVRRPALVRVVADGADRPARAAADRACCGTGTGRSRPGT
ncbi:hypothetical protein [Brachybacterium sp. GPGPB12]|uniref:hypothetical protein n=1 Tax=Brachybacterium sp. GPGPB12 TaxID=3023517 RepID=UPI0031343727